MKIPPVAKVLFGFIIGIGSLQLFTRNMYIDTALAITSLIGIVIACQGMKELKKSSGTNNKIK